MELQVLAIAIIVGIASTALAHHHRKHCAAVARRGRLS
jgi:hypothetical protein